MNAKFSTLKTSLVALKSTTSQSNENGIFIDNQATSNTSNPIQNIPSGVGGMINLNDSPAYPYIMIAHTHDITGQGQGTYSVFSMEDLAKLAKLANNNMIDETQLIFYLATADNTQYAITINDIEKLKAFFGNTSNSNPGAAFDSAKFVKVSNIQDKYYNEITGKIKVNSTSNENDLIAFLELLKEADLGLKMFEVDPTYTTYKKVTLKKVNGINTVKRDDCN